MAVYAPSLRSLDMAARRGISLRTHIHPQEVGNLAKGQKQLELVNLETGVHDAQKVARFVAR